MTASDFVEQVESLHKQYQKQLPPVMDWDPPLSGEMDMRITADGRWIHEGGEIKRQPLVKLFSTILKKEGDDYFLVTPVEKWRIQVEDAPFVVVSVKRIAANEQQPAHLLFTTNTDDQVMADKRHPLWVEHDDKTGEPRPYLMVRHGMPGLIHRNVYYQLVEQALDNNNADKGAGVESCGEFFRLD